MKVYGIRREFKKVNRFAPVIFESGGKFYVQKTKNEFQFYFELEEISEEEILIIEDGNEYNEEFTSCIYGFFDTNENVICGTQQEIFDYLLLKMDEVDDRLVKLKISRILNLNGKTKKLEIDRDRYFKQKNININFDDEKKYVSIQDLSQETKKLLNTTISRYSKKIDDNESLDWNQIILSEPNEHNNLYLDRFRFPLSEVFDILIKTDYNKDLTKNLIERHNTIVSYNIENNLADIEDEDSLEDPENLDDVDIKSIVDFVKNKNKWKEKHS
ncbi:hypothetical protein [Tenacibaculum sp. 190524A05c]|uniref:Uncharacterized protein n=1 Tax=Tenacibaculum platacis TaxID=3137852 RepID=A0ABP1EGG2_9FLAO